jgi:hypothetical protein
MIFYDFTHDVNTQHKIKLQYMCLTAICRSQPVYVGAEVISCTKEVGFAAENQKYYFIRRLVRLLLPTEHER